MPRPICVPCQTEMRCEANGTAVVEMAEARPYRVWDADMWKCPGCAVEIVVGFGQRPIRQDVWADDFAAWLGRYLAAAKRVVYDYERPQSQGEPHAAQSGK